MAEFGKEIRAKEVEVIEEITNELFAATFSDEVFSSAFTMAFRLTFVVPRRTHYFYILEYKTRRKVGVTEDMTRRIHANDSKMKETHRRAATIETFYSVERFIEKAVKKKLSHRKHEGEFYAASFDEVSSIISSYFSEVCVFSENLLSRLYAMAIDYRHHLDVYDIVTSIEKYRKGEVDSIGLENNVLSFLESVSKAIVDIKVKDGFFHCE
jgi:hypothetical protein